LREIVSELSGCRSVSGWTYRFTLLLLSSFFFLASAALAMNMPHYQLDSLVYMSTDIVIADISVESESKFTATVTETLYGALRPGEKLETLSIFLDFYQPMVTEQKVILFLDRRPRPPVFLSPEASKSPFAVLPSGVYLIDTYDHVHEYSQPNNPGLYVAQGYDFFFERTEPTKEQDLALPSLQEVKARISGTLMAVQPMRTLLDKTVTRDDESALVKMLIARPRSRESCKIEMYDAIGARLLEQIHSLDDPELLLKVQALDGIGFLTVQMIRYRDGNIDKELAAGQVRYLVQTLSDRKKDVSIRVAAAEDLLWASSFGAAQSGASRPFSGDVLSSGLEDRVVAAARAVFHNQKEDARLRSVCLQFLDLNEVKNLADIRKLYARTRSEELKFAIEESFLKVSEELYQSLHSPGGPLVSIIEVVPESGCVRSASDKVAFVLKYHVTKNFHYAESSYDVTRHLVLRNTKTPLSFALSIAPRNIWHIGGWDGGNNGEVVFELHQLSDIPSGKYTLGVEYTIDNKDLSTGHTVAIAIAGTSGAKEASVN
jgi:hypothetical protein